MNDPSHGQLAELDWRIDPVDLDREYELLMLETYTVDPVPTDVEPSPVVWILVALGALAALAFTFYWLWSPLAVIGS